MLNVKCIRFFCFPRITFSRKNKIDSIEKVVKKYCIFRSEFFLYIKKTDVEYHLFIIILFFTTIFQQPASTAFLY